MALRIEKAFDVSMDMLLRMQAWYDVLHVRERSGIMARRGAVGGGEHIMHDKGYYHSYTEQVLMAHTPPQSGLA